MTARHRSWWQKIRRPLLIVGILAASILVIVVVAGIIGGYLFNWNWTGLGPYINPPHPKDSDFQRGKTLWDWLQLLIVPLVLAIGGFWFNQIQKDREQKAIKEREEREKRETEQRAKTEREAAEQRTKTEREIAADNQREAALQAYLDKMSDLLLKERLRVSKPEGEVRNVARVRTLRVLPRLDNERKRNVVQFLHESGLINKDNPIISLKEADLRNASLDDAQLQKANLSGAKLMGADLRNANLEGAILYGAKYNKKRIQSRDALGSPLTLEPTQWPPDIDPDDAKLGLISTEH